MSGVTRLETVRVSRAAADQRRGRAGRTEPGICYRLWDEPQTAALEPFARPEILAADLSSFALDLAAWGGGPEQLAFLDPPPRAALTEAKALLAELGAIDGDGRITDGGQALRRLPLPPRLARMVVDAGAPKATPCRPRKSPPSSANAASAATMSICASASTTLRRDRSPRARDARAMAQALGRRCALSAPLPTRGRGALSVPARCWRWPTPNASPRTAAAERARFCSPTAAAPHRSRLAARARAVPRRRRACRHGGAGPHPLAAPITLAEIEARFSDRIEAREEIAFDAASASLRGRRSRRLGAIALVRPADAGRRQR